MELNHGRIQLPSRGCMSPLRGLFSLLSTKVHCPHCHTEATEIRAFLFQGSIAYCKNCGWNIGKATTKLRSDMWAMWLASGIGVLLAATAWMRGSFGIRGALGIAVPFVALPLGSGLVTKYRVSRIAALRPGAPQGARPALATPAAPDQEKDASLAARPRMVRLTMRGYMYTAGVAVATAFVLWLVSLVLRGIASPSNAAIARNVIALFVSSWALWSCVSFFRNRIRERRLFMNGELSQGFVLNQSRTRYGSIIVYTYRDAAGNGFKNRATDFSNRLYEEMPIHVFYDPLNSCESAALESSLYRVG
jgi:hypothetical protein